MVAEAPRIAFFGAMTLLAKEIRSLLESRAFPAGTIRLYDRSKPGTVTEFSGEALLVTPPDEDEIIDLDIAFMCGTEAETALCLDWPQRRGYVAIDLSGASRGRPGVPLVHSEINPGEILGGDERVPPIIAAPHPVSHNLASLAVAARAAGPILCVEALALRPASDLGDPGIDELYQQTVALLNFASVPQEVFGRQIAFNVLPTSGVDSGRAEGIDQRVHEETVRMLALRPGQVSIGSAFAPVFHGHCLWVGLTFEKPPELATLKAALGSSRGIRLLEDSTSSSPVEIAGEEAVAVVDLRPDPHRPGRVTLWSLCDNLKGGSALNAVRIAERVADLRRKKQ